MDSFAVFPATTERWNDLEALFGPRGACGDCWCMYWRLERKVYNHNTGEENKVALMDLTTRNAVPGLLAYIGQTPVGWISIGPRRDYLALENSRSLKRLDDQPVWSVVCFFIAKARRRQNLTSALLEGALSYAAEQGAEMVEGYPIELQTPQLSGQKLSGSSGYMGIASVFRAAGFEEVKRASQTQVIMRKKLK